MFKKILQSLSQSQAAKPEAPRPAATQAKTTAVSAKTPAAAAPQQPAMPKTPEYLCEITPKMQRDQIQAQLKLLYRRYNRSASSLDPKIRAQADQMLDAIVIVREKHFGQI